MFDFNSAQTALRDTFDRAFAKHAGTPDQRVAMARTCISRVPMDHRVNVPITVWATEYARRWPSLMLNEAFHAVKLAQTKFDEALASADDVERTFELMKSLSAAQSRLIDALVKDSGGCTLLSRSGDLVGLVTRDPSAAPDGWRITTANETGFLGHTGHRNKLEAVTEAVIGGFSREGGAEQLKSWRRGSKWRAD